MAQEASHTVGALVLALPEAGVTLVVLHQQGTSARQAAHHSCGSQAPAELGGEAQLCL